MGKSVILKKGNEIIEDLLTRFKDDRGDIVGINCEEWRKLIDVLERKIKNIKNVDRRKCVKTCHHCQLCKHRNKTFEGQLFPKVKVNATLNQCRVLYFNIGYVSFNYYYYYLPILVVAD